MSYDHGNSNASAPRKAPTPPPYSPWKNAPAAVAPDSVQRLVEAGAARMLVTGRIVRVASDEQRFHGGDILLIQTERGNLHARAMSDSVRQSLPPNAFEQVVRRLSPGEASAVLSRNSARAEEARRIFIQEVSRHHVDMHLSGVEVVAGESRIIFYFTSPGRVDFRGLVRDLASALHSRIELRQIGVRDECRCTGGLGPCGQPLCCAAFLTEFSTVTIRMAKTQGLVLNPQKVSGVCGRLMCCLAYEHEVYAELKKNFPKVGSMVKTPQGEGKVREQLIMRNAVRVSLGPGQMAEFPLADIVVEAPKSGKARPPEPEPEEDGPDSEELPSTPES